MTRRAFLTAAGSALASLAIPSLAGKAPDSTLAKANAQGTAAPVDPEWGFGQSHPAKLDLWGRITDFGMPYYDVPGAEAKVIGFLPMNEVMPLFERIHAPSPSGVLNKHNDVWYRISGGHLYTSGVQPMKPYRMPTEISTITTKIEEEPGFWAEVIVPWTFGKGEPSGANRLTDKGDPTTLVYGSSHRVIEAKPDDAGYLWYRIKDDKKGAKSFWALARHLRLISPDDLAPIHPGVPDKRIEINLAEQRMIAYEGSTVVLDTLVSTGGGGFATPKGDHAVVYKQPSRHMYSDESEEAFSDPNFFDLPGVPFNTFFTTEGHAIHGTYWHGDYGRPRSHGCVNVTPEIARWVFRWVEPSTPPDVAANGSSKEPGTPIIVI
jgi:hypothetical protein